jgi:hypothetical protein
VRRALGADGAVRMPLPRRPRTRLMAGRVGKRMREAEARAASEAVATGPTKKQLEASIRTTERSIAWFEEHDLPVTVDRLRIRLAERQARLERGEYR